jgi:aldose 1-epimerase
LTIHASSFLESGPDLLPPGKLLPVEGSPFDFRARKSIGRDYDKVKGGYDHCFVIDGYDAEHSALRPAAEVWEPTSGRTMKIHTTQPGMQLYTGNTIPHVPGKYGTMYAEHMAFCMETQHLPDSPNQASFPSAIFGPNRPYHERAVFSFDW